MLTNSRDIKRRLEATGGSWNACVGHTMSSSIHNRARRSCCRTRRRTWASALSAPYTFRQNGRST